MKALQTTVVSIAVALVFSGCQPTVCERSATADSKSSACGIDPLLGGACTNNIKSCSDADQKILGDVVACAEKLPDCSPLSKDAWLLQQATCTGALSTLSEACSQAFFMGMVPGVDAGVPDSGVTPMTDGGQGVDLYAVANADTVALAWVARQQGEVSKWMLVETDGIGDNRTETELADATAVSLTIADAGMNGRQYFLIGLNPNNAIVTGTPFMMGSATDAGPMCIGPQDCPSNEVCDLGQCRTQTCVAGMANTCPPGYGCTAGGTCFATGADGGFVIGGGTRDAGATPLPFVTNQVLVTPRPPMVQPVVTVGAIPGRRGDVAGVDTARLAMALEQEGQLVAHSSESRGVDLPDDALTAQSMDTLGGRVHLAYNADSKLLYACYVVGRGIRVQVSDDLGRTWGKVARTFEPPLMDDGGIGEIFRDCDIASWTNGGALMVTAEPEALMVYDLAEDLSTNMRGPAFTSILDAGMGSISFPSRPAIATAPKLGIVHITFTGTREISGGASDSEPYGIMREGSGSFSPPDNMTTTLGSALPEDFTAVAVHPVTGRAVGAYTTVNVGSQNSTVYVSLHNNQARAWGTGAHLNIFAVDQNTSVWLPNKPANEAWFGFSPAFAPLPDGTFAFSFVAGPRVNNVGDYRIYMVPFDLDRVPSITTGRGWFVGPVQQLSTDRVVDPRASLSGPQPPVSAIASDGQVSVYGVFTTGTGVNGDVEGTARFFHWP